MKAVLPTTSPPCLGFEVSGLLGLSTLQRLTITIDYPDDLLKLDYEPKLNYDPKLDRQRF